MEGLPPGGAAGLVERPRELRPRSMAWWRAHVRGGGLRQSNPDAEVSNIELSNSSFCHFFVIDRIPLASSTVALALFPRIGGLGATGISALSQTFAMSQRPAASSVINPYLKVPKPPVVTDQSSLASTASSNASSSSGIANPYAKKRDAPSSSAAEETLAVTWTD